MTRDVLKEQIDELMNSMLMKKLMVLHTHKK